jgi:3-dehydroquinate synthase
VSGPGTAAAAETVRVALGERSYDIVVGAGILAELGQRALRWARRKRLIVVSDETVATLHGAAIERALAAAGIGAVPVAVPPGEGSKSFAALEALCERLLEFRVERGDTIVAFGGGVIGDLAGFAAGILLRGIDYIQVPTTLLAQVDSSVGGKTAINARKGKNLVGAFHQPRLVLADTALIDTLPRRQRLSGYAEIAKYGLINDAAFFDWLEGAAAAIVDRAGPERTRAVVTSCRAKAAIVARDEREAGERALLNLGHTFGHAIEAECGYGDAFHHGEAVALGIVLAFRLSAALGLAAPGDAERIAHHFAALGLPSALTLPGGESRRFAAERLIAHMRADKKVAGGALTFILARGIGAAFVARDVPEAAVRETLLAAGAA